jgi:hypothetical protein
MDNDDGFYLKGKEAVYVCTQGGGTVWRYLQQLPIVLVAIMNNEYNSIIARYIFIDKSSKFPTISEPTIKTIRSQVPCSSKDRTFTRDT